MIFPLGEQPAAEQGRRIGNPSAAVVKRELLNDQQQIRLFQIGPVDLGKNHVGAVGDPGLIKHRHGFRAILLLLADRFPPQRACALQRERILFKVFCVVDDNRDRGGCFLGGIVEAVQEIPHQRIVPDQPVGAGADPGVGMTTLFNQPQGTEFCQDPVDGAAVQLGLGGNGGLGRPAHPQTVGVGAQNEEDSQLEGAYLGVI